MNIDEAWLADEASGAWKPEPPDALDACRFEKAGFRSWALTATDGAWKIVVSSLDATGSDPRAFVQVYAPKHQAAFPDLGGFVFRRSIGIYGGTNFASLLKGLTKTLGGSEIDWQRRIDYLITKAMANGHSNEIIIAGVPPELDAPPHVFEGRCRMGRSISFFGPGSAGKTTLADGLAVSLATGYPIVPGWNPVRQMRVGILDWDEGIEEEMIRLRAICLGYGIELPPIYYRRMSRPLTDLADATGSWVVKNGIEVLFISPVGRAMRTTDGDPARAVDEFYEVLRDFETTNFLIDHVVGDAITGGAIREYGSVRKRDSARGSYSVYPQSQHPGRRVIVLRNTKPDALAPAHDDQAIRIEYDPPWPKPNGAYDSITFHEDEIVEAEGDNAIDEVLQTGPASVSRLAAMTGKSQAAVRAILTGNPDRYIRTKRDTWELR
jgi:hypothetical protein